MPIINKIEMKPMCWHDLYKNKARYNKTNNDYNKIMKKERKRQWLDQMEEEK